MVEHMSSPSVRAGLLTLALALVACGPRPPAAASRPAPPREPPRTPTPSPAPTAEVDGPDLYFDGPPRWDPGETLPELVLTVRNRKGAGPAAGPVTVSAMNVSGEHRGQRPAYPATPLAGDAELAFRVVMSSRPPSGTRLTISVSYANDDTDQNPSDNAITFRVP